MPESYITKYTAITTAGLYVNGEQVYAAVGKRGVEFLTAAYTTLGISYPKFYKMDSPCKAAFIAAELLFQNTAIQERYKSEDIAIVLSTAHGSLDTDLRYMASVAQSPSPSLFVYTLANVMLGEICIRHGIKGENTCFVKDEFDAAFQTNYVNSLLQTGKAEVCLSGWADYIDGEVQVFFMLVEKNLTSLNLHNPLIVQNIYTHPWKN